MALLDKVQGELQLYIGGLFTLKRKDALREAGITHVLSVLRLPLDPQLFEPFVHKVVEVDDVDDENLLDHLPACIRFIQDGLDSAGGVLVHCAMGKSRSATCVCAYLMHHHSINPAEALAQLRQSRAICEPNDGFMKQLWLYYEMNMPADVESHPRYQRWLYQRELALSRECGLAPEAEKIRFEDEHSQHLGSADFELRCKKCRRSLATSQYLVRHQPKSATIGEITSTDCAHYFLDPLSWMRSELEQGKIDGRLECPKCKTNVGKYAWQGMQCSCADWIVPGISLAKAKTDRVKAVPQSTSQFGIRMPPTTATPERKGGQQNL